MDRGNSAVQLFIARRGETPVEARIRFLDAERGYRIASVSARRLDRAEGGVISIDAPIVLDAVAAEQLAQRVLADRRAAGEAADIAVSPLSLSIEPGDRVSLGAEAFEVMRIVDAEARSLELRRARSNLPFQAALAELGAPALPGVAPAPALSVLDLPPLPENENDDRPLAALFAAPWQGAHALFAGADADLLTQRASATQAAVMGELLWALWPGPVDRWDDGNRIRVRVYGGQLESVSRTAVLNGANAFAIEAGGEWEIVQAASCVLVAPGEYELSGFLRGRLGSAHAMAAPHMVGARIVKLDQRLARVSMAAHEWGEALLFSAPPYGAEASGERATQISMSLPHAALRPWAPAHLRAQRAAGNDVAISWIRCARIGGDSWGAGEPPIGAAAERYQVEILDSGGVLRAATVDVPAWTYSAAQQTADFGSIPGALTIRVAQLDSGGATGLNKQLTITL